MEEWSPLFFWRSIGHWMHPSSGHSYHTKFSPPKVPGVDHVTGDPLIQWKDDTAKVLKSRLESFQRQPEPVIQYHMKKGIVGNIHAEKPPNEVVVEIQKHSHHRSKQASIIPSALLQINKWEDLFSISHSQCKHGNFYHGICHFIFELKYMIKQFF
jgi:hypothetical protein